jgi:RND family efflux transporter MFP subunit
VQEAAPIVNGCVIFVSTPSNQVMELEAATGKLLCRYVRPRPKDVFVLNYTNRGVSLFGDRVYYAAAESVLVALDVSVERAELAAARAQADLAATTLGRLERLRTHQATSQEEVDQARAQRDVAFARITQIEATIAKKTIRAPFRARVGIADVHPGQYLNEGAELTPLQGVADAVPVDFEVSQAVAASLHEGARVSIVTADGVAPIEARISAIDARVDPTTRNAKYQAKTAIDMSLVRLGDLGSAALVALGASLSLGVAALAWANVAIAMVWLVVNFKLGTRYRAATRR